MLSTELRVASAQLAECVTMRSELIERWTAIACSKPDPVVWTNAFVAAAISRLAATRESPMFEEARRDLENIRHAMLDQISTGRSLAPRLRRASS